MENYLQRKVSWYFAMFTDRISQIGAELSRSQTGFPGVAQQPPKLTNYIMIQNDTIIMQNYGWRDRFMNVPATSTE